jgi:hypothetical protein
VEAPVLIEMSFRWYDLIVTDSTDASFVRHHAGPVENGFDSVSISARAFNCLLVLERRFGLRDRPKKTLKLLRDRQSLCGSAQARLRRRQQLKKMGFVIFQRAGKAARHLGPLSLRILRSAQGGQVVAGLQTRTL